MFQKSLAMLVEMIGGRFEAPTRVVPAQFKDSMDASSFEHEQIWHGLIQFHVQFYSKLLHDHESTNRKCSCVKKLKKSLRENFGNSWDSDLKSLLILKTIMIIYIYLMLIMFRNYLSQMQMILINFEGVSAKWVFHPHARIATWTVLIQGPKSLKMSSCKVLNWFCMLMINQNDFMQFSPKNFMNKPKAMQMKFMSCNSMLGKYML